MSAQAIFTLLLTLVAAGLLISERLRPDLIALLIMVVLGLSGVVGEQETFFGFSGSAVMTIMGISIISAALHETGVTHLISRFIHRAARNSETRLILATMLASAGLSLFMNNIAAVGVLLPAVMTVARRTRTAPSTLLMPLAFGTILGGMATLLTTSNIIVSGALRDAGYSAYGLLDFFPIGLPIVVVGIVYMLTLGRRLMPANTKSIHMTETIQQLGTRLATLYAINENLKLIKVMPGSPLANRSLAEGEWATRTGLIVVGLVRNGQTMLAPRGTDLIRENDSVIVHGQFEPQCLAENQLQADDRPVTIPAVMDETVVLAELVVAPHADLIGRTLKTAHFRERYNVTVLAIWRDGKPVHSGIADLELRFGDALLIQGPAGKVHLLHNEANLILLEEDPDAVLRPSKAGVTIAISLLTLAIAASGILPVAQVVFGGAVVLLLVQALTMNDAYRSIEWRAVFLIAGMWPLSIAIRTTGLADASVGLLTSWFGQASGLMVGFALLVVSLLLTQLMSGQVAALVLAPLALVAAETIQADPRAMGMAVALGCSLAFLTPFGHPVNVMVMNSGGYTIKDFVRVGGPLTILVIAAILLGLRTFWGLH